VKKSRAPRASSSSTTRCARATKAEREAKLVREPVLNVHNDYTELVRAAARARPVPGEAEALLQRRFRDHPGVARDQFNRSSPTRSPIADARSLAPRDLIRASAAIRTGWARPTASATTRSPLVLFPLMRRDEALVFKVFDSAKDGRCALHRRTAVRGIQPTPKGRSSAPEHRGAHARFFDS